MLYQSGDLMLFCIANAIIARVYITAERDG